MTVRNPILRGSHPDPSVVRVGDEYVIATSTFEWYPGVRLHRSRDLASWQDVGGALRDSRPLDLTGVPDSGGVWAPSLSYVDGLFHLVYSNVSTYTGGFTDAPSYVVTAPSIDGTWSDPVLLHARGFDASLFHDGPDSWLVNLVHDWRPGRGGSAGLEATPYDRRTRTLVGPPVRLDLPPTDSWIEGPNVYRRGDWYYLVTADGGTGYEHQVTVARSRSLAGPYERDPRGPLLTAKHRPDWPLQKAGHGSLVATPDDEWYLAFLVARPHGERGPCILGRETALARVDWVDGWPSVTDPLPPLEVEVVAQAQAVLDEEDDFDLDRLGPQWSTLRRPPTDDWLDLTSRPSHLRIHGGRSPQSAVGASLVARRVTEQRCGFEATIELVPTTFQHAAGITAYYNTRSWSFLHVTAADDGSTVLRVAHSDRGVVRLDPAVVALPPGAPVRLGLDLDGDRLAFRYATGAVWQAVGAAVDAAVLSDEHAVELDAAGQVRAMGFTGAFVGMWVWDLTGHGHHADVDAARYTTR